MQGIPNLSSGINKRALATAISNSRQFHRHLSRVKRHQTGSSRCSPLSAETGNRVRSRLLFCLVSFNYNFHNPICVGIDFIQRILFFPSFFDECRGISSEKNTDTLTFRNTNTSCINIVDGQKFLYS